jgi:transcriptional regulator with XRE-family HTH domain
MADKIDYSLANSEQIVADLGARLGRLRLASNITQADLAARAGVGTRTLARLEGGEGGTMDSLVRVIVALGLNSHLEALLPDPDIRPMERVQLRGRERQRARASSLPPARASFRWGDR